MLKDGKSVKKVGKHGNLSNKSGDLEEVVILIDV